MSIDFLKIAQAHVASTGSNPRIVIQEMEGELEKVAGIGSMLAGGLGKAWKGAKGMGTGFASKAGGMLSSGASKGRGMMKGIKGYGKDLGTAFRSGSNKGTAAFSAQRTKDIIKNAPASTSMGGKKLFKPPGTSDIPTPGIKGATNTEIPAGGTPDIGGTSSQSGMEIAQKSEAQAAGGPGFMQKHFNITPGHADGILGGKGIGKWWEGTTDNQKLKVMGAAGAGAAGAGYMLGGSGGGRTQVIYS